MKSLSEKILAPIEGESAEVYEERAEAAKQIIANAMDCTAGRRLLDLLTFYEAPYEPRFCGTTDPIEAAVRDGRKEVVALLTMHKRK